MHPNAIPVAHPCLQNTGTSLLETFTAEQIELHIDSLYAAAAQVRAAQPQPPDACKVSRGGGCGGLGVGFRQVSVVWMRGDGVLDIRQASPGIGRW